MSSNISAVIITKNEEQNIRNCINSLKFCDEIIVIDDYSKDKTPIIARTLGAKVFFRKLGNDFSSQRNFGLSKTKSRWVLFLDADEIVTAELQKEILQKLSKPVNYTSGYFFKRTDYIWKTEVKHGEVGDVRLLRLARRDAGKWDRYVHEHWHVIGMTEYMSQPIKHYPHPTVKEFLFEVNHRSTLHALANKMEGKKANLFIIIFYPVYKFIYGYILRGGFLDGMVGFVIAMIMSLHSFMSWSKLWFIQKN